MALATTTGYHGNNGNIDKMNEGENGSGSERDADVAVGGAFCDYKLEEVLALANNRAKGRRRVKEKSLASGTTK